MFRSVVAVSHDWGSGFPGENERRVSFDGPVAEVLLEVASQGGRVRLNVLMLEKLQTRSRDPI